MNHNIKMNPVGATFWDKLGKSRACINYGTKLFFFDLSPNVKLA